MQGRRVAHGLRADSRFSSERKREREREREKGEEKEESTFNLAFPVFRLHRYPHASCHKHRDFSGRDFSSSTRARIARLLSRGEKIVLPNGEKQQCSRIVANSSALTSRTAAIVHPVRSSRDLGRASAAGSRPAFSIPFTRSSVILSSRSTTIPPRNDARSSLTRRYVEIREIPAGGNR